MSTIFKVGIGAGLIALVMWGSSAAKSALSSFKVKIVSFGRPTLANMILTVPLQIRFNNPTSLPISVDQLRADIYIDKNGQFIPAAIVNQSVTIAPGESFQWVAPALNLPSIFGGNFIETTNAITQILSNKKLRVRANVNAVYKGIEIPEQTFTKNIAL